MRIDFDETVILNESRDPDQAGDVTIFKTIADAEAYIEPIDVQNREYFAYLPDGRELDLSVIKGRVHIEKLYPSENHCNRVRNLLNDLAIAVFEARKVRGRAKEKLDFETMSIAGLIEFIGFSR
jgi:hypothetical protein